MNRTRISPHPSRPRMPKPWSSRSKRRLPNRKRRTEKRPMPSLPNSGIGPGRRERSRLFFRAEKSRRRLLRAAAIRPGSGLKGRQGALGHLQSIRLPVFLHHDGYCEASRRVRKTSLWESPSRTGPKYWSHLPCRSAQKPAQQAPQGDQAGKRAFMAQAANQRTVSVERLLSAGYVPRADRPMNDLLSSQTMVGRQRHKHAFAPEWFAPEPFAHP